MLTPMIVLLLSFAVLYFYLEAQKWRWHTASANRRRKRVEEEAKEARRTSYFLFEENKVIYLSLGQKSRANARLIDEVDALVKECRETREVLTERVVALQGERQTAIDMFRRAEEERNRSIAALTTAEVSLARSREAYTIANAAAIQNGWYRQICERIEVLPEITNVSERYRLTRRNVEGKWVPIRKPRLGKRSEELAQYLDSTDSAEATR